MKKAVAISLIAIMVMFSIPALFYEQLPNEIPSHWNAAGEVDGHMSKFWGVFMMPIIAGCLLILFLAIPRIDPLKANIKKFMSYYEGMIVFMIAFLTYVQILMTAYALSHTFNFVQFMLPAMGFIFIYMGFLVEKAKRNWFVGIRTPWTLSNEKVWDKTHKLGGTLFKVSGIITLFGVLAQGYEIWFMIIPVLASAFFLFVYSYFEYRKQVKR